MTDSAMSTRYGFVATWTPSTELRVDSTNAVYERLDYLYALQFFLSNEFRQL